MDEIYYSRGVQRGGVQRARAVIVGWIVGSTCKIGVSGIPDSLIVV